MAAVVVYSSMGSNSSDITALLPYVLAEEQVRVRTTLPVTTVTDPSSPLHWFTMAGPSENVVVYSPSGNGQRMELDDSDSGEKEKYLKF